MTKWSSTKLKAAIWPEKNADFWDGVPLTRVHIKTNFINIGNFIENYMQPM